MYCRPVNAHHKTEAVLRDAVFDAFIETFTVSRACLSWFGVTDQQFLNYVSENVLLWLEFKGGG